MMMERRVKERLIGATLLVVLIVLVVPEMLSGPKPPTARPLTAGLPAATRSVSVDLTTSKATADPDLADGAPASGAPGEAASGAAPDGAQAAASGAASDDDASGRTPPEPSAPASAPTVTTLKAQEPAGAAPGAPAGPSSATAVGAPGESSLETPASSPKSQVHRGWSVQLGSFASRANAERLVHQVQARGGATPYVSPIGSGSSLRYRVRVGPYSDRGAAERAAGKLKAAGHAGTLVAPAS